VAPQSGVQKAYIIGMVVLRSVLRLTVVLGLVLSTQGLLLVQGAYLLRQDFIAEHLCVNRDKPEEDCHGKCHLRKQLERQQQRQKEERQAASLVLLIGGSLLAAETVALPEPSARTVAYAPPPEARAPAPPATEVFHPPQAA